MGQRRKEFYEKKKITCTCACGSDGGKSCDRLRQFWIGRQRRLRKFFFRRNGKGVLPELQTEQADQWVELAKTYTDETGVQVDVQTAASGTYESQLKSEMAKDEAPTLFQVNGPVGLAT